MRLRDDKWCFACGRDNPHGLRLEFRADGEEYVCDFVPQRHHQGWSGVVHGGIVATLLDETITRMLCDRGSPVVTADLHVRLKRPTPVGQPVQVRARLLERRREIITAAAELLLADGTVTATAEAKLMGGEPA